MNNPESLSPSRLTEKSVVVERNPEAKYPRPAVDCDCFRSLIIMGKRVLLERSRNGQVSVSWKNGVVNESLCWDEKNGKFDYMIECEKGEPSFCDPKFIDACTQAVLSLSDADKQEYFGELESTEKTSLMD